MIELNEFDFPGRARTVDDISFRAAMTLCGWNFELPKKYTNYSCDDDYLNDDDITCSVYTDDDTLDTIMRNLIEWYSIDFEYGFSPQYVSLWDEFDVFLEIYGWYENYTSSGYFFQDCRGYQGLTLAVAARYLDWKNANDDSLNCDTAIEINDDRLKLNEEVTAIEYYEDGVYVYTKTTDGSDDTFTYAAYYAVSTVSVGVLQSGLIEFEPELPFWKRYSIAEYSMAPYIRM